MVKIAEQNLDLEMTKIQKIYDDKTSELLKLKTETNRLFDWAYAEVVRWYEQSVTEILKRKRGESGQV
jgi:predicted outer membrane protein